MKKPAQAAIVFILFFFHPPFSHVGWMNSKGDAYLGRASPVSQKTLLSVNRLLISGCQALDGDISSTFRPLPPTNITMHSFPGSAVAAVALLAARATAHGIATAMVHWPDGTL